MDVHGASEYCTPSELHPADAALELLSWIKDGPLIDKTAP